MTGFLAQAMAAEEADDIVSAASHYAAALDGGEVADWSIAIRAALTFFEAKDGGRPPITEDAYWYFDRWIAQAEAWGGGATARFWKRYDALIYGDGDGFDDEVRSWYSAGSDDALLSLSAYFPGEFATEVAAFVEQVRPQETYRERYLYSILASRSASGKA